MFELYELLIDFYLFLLLQSVDDWKQRRRQKKNLPSTSRLTQLGEEEFDDKPQKSDRKRINKFENSQYYIMPLVSDGNNDGIDEMLNSNEEKNSENINCNNISPKTINTTTDIHILKR